MKSLTTIFLFFFVLGLPTITWGVNLYKLTQCDFQESWKGEIIHAAGVIIPPASLITVWLNYK
jgi:hypothetical protein